MSIILQILLSLAVTTMLMKFVTSTTYTVGAPNGQWDFSTDLQTWASSKSFKVGDSLLFQYLPGAHDVLQVSEADYTSCTATSPNKSYSSGNDVVPLVSAGKTYFICGQIGHCVQGMKMEIDTLGSTTTPASPPSPTLSPPASSPSTAPASSPSEGTLSPPSPVFIPSPENSPSPEPSSFESPADIPSPTSPTTSATTNSTSHNNTASGLAHRSSAYRSHSNAMLVGSMMMVFLAL